MTKKTYKRELAVGLLGSYFAFLVTGFWHPDALAAAESVKVPAFTFATGAFALDAVVKQWE